MLVYNVNLFCNFKAYEHYIKPSSFRCTFGYTDSKLRNWSVSKTAYLRQAHYERDIIDGWQLKKSGKWQKKHTRFFRVVLKMIEKHKTEVIYIRGNHDDFLDNVLPFAVGNLSIVKDHIHESNGKRYWYFMVIFLTISLQT